LNTHRKDIAKKILNKFKIGNYYYLGEGFSGIVFHDYIYSYKVHIPFKNFASKKLNLDYLHLLNEKVETFKNRKHFFAIKEIVEIDNYKVLISDYKPSKKIKYLDRLNLISFLSECWRMNIIIADIKETNFVRYKNTIKMVDVEIEQYSDNLFLNMIVRSYIRFKFINYSKEYLLKLNRCAFDNFDFEELIGAREFSNSVFKRIIHDCSKIKKNKNGVNNESIKHCYVRDENVVFVINIKDIVFPKFVRFWHSIISQTFSDWGMIIIGNIPENKLDFSIKEFIKKRQYQITYINDKKDSSYNSVLSIIKNKDCKIIHMEAEGTLLGNNTLKEIIDIYKDMNADLVIGKLYRADKLSAHYEYTPNLINPSLNRDSILHHLLSFKKDLYDDIAKNNEQMDKLDYITEILRSSKNPFLIRRYNYYYDK
jgi:hypothetical protein